MQSRKAIGQALGLAMERYQLDEDRALQFLIRASHTANEKLRDLATQLIQTANEARTPKH